MSRFQIGFKKKVLAVSLVGVVFVSCSGFTWQEKTNTQKTAHEIAELARSLGLNESDQIIQRAQAIWWEAENTPTYSEEDLRILANVIHYEAGNCPDRHQQLVAQVVLNRVKDNRFPNTVKGVVQQPGQYAAWYVTATPKVSQRCYNNAKAALEGKVNCPANVVFQAQFRQGTGVYETSYVNTGWWSSTTYFCYG